MEFCKRSPKGNVLLQLTPEQPPEGLLGEHNINGVKVLFTMPAHLNVVKGIIHHPELALMDAQEVAEMLQDDGVVAAQKPAEAPYCVLSWKRSTGTSLPATVLVGWDRVRVKKLQPRPKRCYCCQGYGHTATECNKNPVCSRCGQEHQDEEEECSKEPHCAGCGGPHAATDKQCPKWQEEKQVMKIRRDQKISYSDAVKKMKKKEEPKKKEEDKKKEEEENKKKEEERKKKEEEKKREEQQQDEEEETTTEEEIDVEEEEETPKEAPPAYPLLEDLNLAERAPWEVMVKRVEDANERTDLPTVFREDIDTQSSFAWGYFVWTREADPKCVAKLSRQRKHPKHRPERV